MKKAFIIAGAVIVVLAVVGFLVFVLSYTGVLDPKVVDNRDVYYYTTDDGLSYTEAEFTWHAMEGDEVIQYVENYNIPSTVIAMNLDGNTYYDISIPDKEIIYDFGKTVYAVDGSFVIRILGGAKLDNLSALAGIDNGIAVNQITLVSNDKVKGRRTIVTIVDDSAIVVDVYGTNEEYSLLRDSLATNHASREIGDIPYSANLIRLSEISYEGSFAPQVVYKDVSLTQQRYLFADGSLYTQSVVEPFYKAKREYLARLVATSGGQVDTLYEDDDALFAKSGDYYVGVINYNTNTSIVLIGKGEEAYCNIVSVMALAN